MRLVGLPCNMMMTMSLDLRLAVVWLTGLFAWASQVPAHGQMSPQKAMELLRQAEAAEQKQQPDHPPASSDAASQQPDQTGASTGGPEPIAWSRMPKRLSAVFEREAHGYLRVNGRIVAIDGWLQRARLPQNSRRREPFTTPDAPLFFDPVTGKRARALSDLASEANLENIVLLYGTVADAQGPMALINTVRGLAVVRDLPEPAPRDPQNRVLVIGRPDGEATIHVGDRRRTVPLVRYAADGPVRPVTAAELAEWVQVHNIGRFEQWRARKVWDERPKAKRVYESAGGMGGGGIGVGRAEPREVITDPGEYHWEWIRGGRRVPTIFALPNAQQPPTDTEADTVEPVDPTAGDRSSDPPADASGLDSAHQPTRTKDPADVGETDPPAAPDGE